MAETPTPDTNDYDKLRRLRQQIKLERRRLALAKANGVAFYKPHPGQDAFHRAGDRKLRMVRSGNRFGKSLMGCAEDIAWLLGYRPWYPKEDPARELGIPRHPVKGLVICASWQKVKEVWTGSTGKMWQLLPKTLCDEHDIKRNHEGVPSEFFCKNGSYLAFATVESFKKNPMLGESSDWDFVHIDEPCPEDMFKAAARGLMDRGGFCWFTLTPLSEFWINDLFFPQYGVEAKYPPDKIWAYQGNTNDNPYLSSEDIEDFTRLLTPDEIQCRLHGIPLELSGLVYKAFNYKKHVLQTIPTGWGGYNKPPRNYIIYVSIDVHVQTPDAVLFIAVDPMGRRYIYDELWIRGTYGDLAKLILMKLEGYYYTIPQLEPAAWIRHPGTDKCAADEFAMAGLYCEKASKAKDYGITKMQGEFSLEGNIWVAPNLQRFLYEIHRYCYDKENKPIDENDHMMECMYRAFINNPIWFNPDGRSENNTSEEQITSATTTLTDISFDEFD